MSIENRFIKKFYSTYRPNHIFVPVAKTRIPYTILKRQFFFRFLNTNTIKNICANNDWGHYRSSTFNGNRPHSKCIMLSFDCDYDKDTSALYSLLPILKEYNAPSSFGCVGNIMQKDPGIYQQIVNDGHEIINHTDNHYDNFNELTDHAIFKEIFFAHTVIEEITGKAPIGFRSPHCIHNRFVYPWLEYFGYTYASNVFTSASMLDIPYHPAKLGLGDYSHCVSSSWDEDNYPFTMIPMDTCPKCKGMGFSSYHYIRPGKGVHNEKKMLANWKLLLKRSESKRTVCIYLDPMDLMRHIDTIDMFREMLKYAFLNGWDFKTMGGYLG